MTGRNPELQSSLFLRSLAGEVTSIPPVWLMRQAGRYLPEYRETRKKAKTFLDLCYTPELAIEVTLQPIRRFGFDASIMFSDILVVPDALGQKVWFVEGEGPKLEPLKDETDLAKLSVDRVLAHLDPVFQTIRGLKQSLPASTPLIGFCGAPHTVATYMIGGGSGTQSEIIRRSYEAPGFVRKVIDQATEASIRYLKRQIDEGVDAIQLFESWASAVPPALVEDHIIAPLRRIVTALKAYAPQMPILAFPRTMASEVVRATAQLPVSAISIETGLSLSEARKQVGQKQALQGNLDPLLMVTGGDAIDRAVDAARATMQGHPYILNLGHGITPDASIASVERLLKSVRG
jgi:uroporphyrinogen decarboxylase